METVIFPEMIQAGIQTLREEKDRNAPESETVLAVYLAMHAILAIQCMYQDSESLH